MTRRNPESKTNILAMSKAETLLISSSGDVIVIRDRNSVYPSLNPRQSSYKWNNDVLGCCEGDDLSTRIQDSNICAPNCNWGEPTKGGLLGGAPPADPMPLSDINKMPKDTYKSVPIDQSIDSSIVPIKSFDYAHFDEGGNDMLPEHRHIDDENHPKHTPTEAPRFMHGIPSFHTSFSHAKISQVSSHPLGSHVLLISDNGLLYSYGFNNYGQLGIGLKSSTTAPDKGYIMEPTILTPLVEGGGKAIACAAGVDYSLVVVATQQERLPVVAKDAESVTTQDESTSSIESLNTFHRHQVYAFGRNDNGKLGLVDNKKSDCALLPRRVALSAKVRPHCSEEEFSSSGIFCIEASVDHSAALVRKRSGEVEMYTWGNSSHGALGFPVQKGSKYVKKPTLVTSLSTESKDDCILRSESEEFPTAVFLGSSTTFVMTTLGRCVAFGESKHGLLGLGNETREIAVPTDLGLQDILSLSVGAEHAVALTTQGEIFGWGKAAYLPSFDPAFVDPDGFIWEPVNIATTWEAKENSRKLVECCAGFDSIVLVDQTGRALSCGRASGRLGLGEQETEVDCPTPMFGGLRLWHNRSQVPFEIPQIPQNRHLTKGITIG